MPESNNVEHSTPCSPHDIKPWLDRHVIPLLIADPPASLHSFLWKGSPLTDVLVWALCDPATPTAWPQLAHRLLTADDFRFDFTREAEMVPLGTSLVPIFGGDGTPTLLPNGMASVRLFRTEDDGTHLLLQLGCRFTLGESPSGHQGAEAIKAFFALFDASPIAVCQQFGALFGQA